MVAECSTSLALLAQHAWRLAGAEQQAQDETLAASAANALLPLLLEPELGASFPSFMAEECCGWNAANALLHLCSSPTADGARASAPTFRGGNQVVARPGTHTIGGMVE